MTLILKRVESKKEVETQDKSNVYARVAFTATDEFGNDISVRSNISISQWDDLKKSFELQQGPNGDIITNKVITITFNDLEILDNGNRVFEFVKGIYNQKEFEYWKLSSKVLIDNGLINKTVYPKVDKF